MRTDNDRHPSHSVDLDLRDGGCRQEPCDVVEAVALFDVTSTSDTCALRMTETPVGALKLMAPLARPLIGARNERSLQRLAAFVDTHHVPGTR